MKKNVGKKAVELTLFISIISGKSCVKCVKDVYEKRHIGFLRCNCHFRQHFCWLFKLAAYSTKTWRGTNEGATTEVAACACRRGNNFGKLCRRVKRFQRALLDVDGVRVCVKNRRYASTNASLGNISQSGCDPVNISVILEM